MARKFATAIDLVKNELQNAAVQSLASAPASPVKFQLYGNTTDNTVYWWDGTTWVTAKGGSTSYGTITAETTFGTSKSDGVAVTAARSDHAHGNPSHTFADHASYRLDQWALPTAAINMNGQYIQNLLNPVASSDA